MRILQVCPYDWFATGGVQTHVAQLSDELERRGHEVLIAAPGAGRSDEARVRILGRPLRVPFNGTVAPVCPSVSAIFRVRRLLQEFQPDVCHAHEPFAPSIALWAGVQTRAPLVVTFHAHVDLRIGPALYSLGTWPLNRRARAGIAVSPAAINCLSQRVRVPFTIVPNGVDPRFGQLESSQAHGRPPRILFAHRLEPRKGFRVAVEAFERVAAQHPSAEFIVVGAGPDLAYLERLSENARQRVRVLGTLTRHELIEQFAAANVFVAPALNGESFGVVLIEAMAAGLPVVASDIPGYREVTAGGGALLAPAGNARAVADAILRVLAEPDLAREMAELGRARSMAFSWQRVADAVEGVYRGVTADASMALKRAAI